ncbi:MAG TPA: MerR family transcriptional regulator [Acidimicrobiales bacterium]|nr:MerR family transcriptional regulator [Acidimicrobiales bacterium]
MGPATLSIGEFARATHLSVKTLRYYHDAGLLVPVEIDPHSGYRRYGVEQIATAQVIRRLRDLGMPVDDVRAVLRAADPTVRGDLIARHLRRLEDELGRTQKAVASLRDLLEHPVGDFPVHHRHLPAAGVAAISETIATADASAWLQGALGELYATATAQGADEPGPAGGVYSGELFEGDGGLAVVYLPATLRPVGRIRCFDRPDVDLAVVTHRGPENGIDRAYGALAAYVARHTLGVDGPIHEFYPINRHHTADPTRWRTEIGWPVFATHPA